MSLRDRLARAAMNGMLSNMDVPSLSFDSDDDFDNYIAERSYGIADAMLKERERTNKSQAQKELEK